MKWQELVVDGFGMIHPLLEEALDGLSTHELDWQPKPGCNSIGWTVWHLARIEDGGLAGLMERPQLWVEDGWAMKFNRKPDAGDDGYGHTPEQVAAFRSPAADVLLAYCRAVEERSKPFLMELTEADLDKRVNEPGPDTALVGFRLMAVLADVNQHAGEVSYLRGLLKGPLRT